MYLVLAVIFLHLIAMPQVFSCSVFLDSEKKVGKIKVKFFFIPIFIRNADFDNLSYATESQGDSEKKSDRSKKKSGFAGVIKRYFIRFALKLAGRVRVRELLLDCKLGLGDAAATAVATGFVGTVYQDACAVTGCRWSGLGGIGPDYDSERVYIDFFGIFSLCFADIIYASISALRRSAI